jgi:hypothetical protein
MQVSLERTTETVTVFGLIDIIHLLTLFVSTAPGPPVISLKMTLAVP